jgi:hypothetical protein
LLNKPADEGLVRSISTQTVSVMRAVFADRRTRDAHATSTGSHWSPCRGADHTDTSHNEKSAKVPTNPADVRDLIASALPE